MKCMGFGKLGRTDTLPGQSHKDIKRMGFGKLGRIDTLPGQPFQVHEAGKSTDNVM